MGKEGWGGSSGAWSHPPGEDRVVGVVVQIPGRVVPLVFEPAWSYDRHMVSDSDFLAEAIEKGF